MTALPPDESPRFARGRALAAAWLRTPRSSPDDQGVTFVELFFDLVFVFAVTEVTGFLRMNLDPAGVVRFLLIFWLVWWAWTQFTWALNAANTDNHLIQAATLLAVGLAFAMAMAVERAYEGNGLWFAIPYVAVRLVGLVVYRWASVEHAERRRAVESFAILSALGLAAVLVGAILPDPSRTAAWFVVVVLDLVAARFSGSEAGWDVRPGHFAERHGLFVILALGESLIAAGAPAADAQRSHELVLTATAAVSLTAATWWTYFAHMSSLIEGSLGSRSGSAQASLARDAYTLLHFPLLAGVVAMAAGMEEAVAHPDEPLFRSAAWSLAVGLAAFLIATSLVHRRADHGWFTHRIGAAIMFVTFTAIGATELSPWVFIAAAALLLIITLTVEELRYDQDPDVADG